MSTEWKKEADRIWQLKYELAVGIRNLMDLTTSDNTDDSIRSTEGEYVMLSLGGETLFAIGTQYQCQQSRKVWQEILRIHDRRLYRGIVCRCKPIISHEDARKGVSHIRQDAAKSHGAVINAAMETRFIEIESEGLTDNEPWHAFKQVMAG